MASEHFIVARHIRGGGSIGVAYDHYGNAVYVEGSQHAVKFVERADAQRFMAYCDRCLPTYAGQEDFEVVRQAD